MRVVKIPSTQEMEQIVANGIKFHGPGASKIAAWVSEQITRIAHDRPVTGEDAFQQVAQLVADTLLIDAELFAQKCRKREVVEARQTLAYILNVVFGLSLKATGQKLGGQDHSTIIHAKLTVSDLIRSNKVFRDKFNRCLTFAKELLHNNDQQEQKDRIVQDTDFAVGHA